MILIILIITLMKIIITTAPVVIQHLISNSYNNNNSCNHLLKILKEYLIDKHQKKKLTKFEQTTLQNMTDRINHIKKLKRHCT